MASEYQLAFYRNITAAHILDSSISSCRRAIEEYKKLVGPNSYSENRIRFLETACTKKDVRNYLAPRRDVDLASAIHVVGYWLGSNEGVNVKWVSSLPVSLDDPHFSGLYRQVVENVGLFLTEIISHWTQLAQECNMRGYPPLMSELVERICLVSPVLQHMMFNTLCTNMKVCDDMKADFRCIFDRDQSAYTKYVSRKAIPAEISNWNRSIREEYNVILLKYLNGQMPTSRKQGYNFNNKNIEPSHSMNNEPSIRKKESGTIYDVIKDKIIRPFVTSVSEFREVDERDKKLLKIADPKMEKTGHTGWWN
ncbi:hypothetical protein F5884DRAFT_837912 [Xylogone sp. PMI_703]|nr:hypothetical protein F5884DRAFT_837912 [Xylogone sp. PMI_703]